LFLFQTYQTVQFVWTCLYVVKFEEDDEAGLMRKTDKERERNELRATSKHSIPHQFKSFCSAVTFTGKTAINPSVNMTAEDKREFD
jgi:hypothetical protein